MSGPNGGGGWSLEVVRGREVGRRFPLPGDPIVLGNAVGHRDGIDLSGQEGDSPRRMAARQAVVETRPDGPVLRDLESPGGTFVNRRRLLPGQDQALKPGDVIQLGGIQLRVVAQGPNPAPPPGPAAAGARPATAAPATTPKPPPPRPAPAPAATASLAFAMNDGTVCRSWDDFLTVSAQRWGVLRDELTSGRLAGYLAASGRADLAPRPDAPGSPDDRLDTWLGSLPTTRPARPELDVHPRALAVRATPGARTRQSFRVANVGFRLLRSTARVEPADAGWLAIPPEFAGEFATVEETEIPVLVTAPDPLPGRMTATVVVEGNGGTARVAVMLEPAGAGPVEPSGTAIGDDSGPIALDELRARCSDRLAGLGPRTRVIGGALVGLAFRLGIGVACGLSGLATLPGPALVLAATGAVAGAIGIARKGGHRDVPSGAFAGAFGGLTLAALAVACCQAIEPILGPTLSRDLVAVAVLWSILGAAIGGASLLVVPERRAGREASA